MLIQATTAARLGRPEVDSRVLNDDGGAFAIFLIADG